LLANGLAGQAQLAFLSAEYDNALELFASVRAILDELGVMDDPWLAPFTTCGEISVALDRGQRLDDTAFADLSGRFELALSKQQFIGVMYLGVCLVGAAMERSDHAAARQRLDFFAAISEDGETGAEVVVRLASSALHHHGGDPSAALADVERGRVACRVRGDDIGGALFDVRAGLIALSRGDIGDAESLIHTALRTVSDRGFRREVVIALEAVVLTEAASKNWLDVARLHGAASRLRVQLGYRLRTSPERESYAQAIAALGDEHSNAVAEGASMDWPAAVEYALRTWGARKRPAFGWQSLTPTELQVVGLAAQGLTNPLIADQLIMGRATVKTHLSNAYTKLGVKNRTELATLAASKHPEWSSSAR
jgi:DNA-binding CsgD family transcriptional regulator